jgi:murein DD-endopeptidase MepM/ murein hydrolase activator NlpD
MRAPRDPEAVAADVIARIDADDGAGLVDLYGPRMRSAFPVYKTAPFVHGIVEAHGHSKAMAREDEGNSRADGTWRVTAERGEWRLELHLQDDGSIAGLQVTAIGAAGPPVARSSIPLSLPFRGEWKVGWGGDRPEVNHHVGVPSQRRAADLLVVGADGKTHRTDGKTNADYLAYGQEVLAVADGTVVTVIDGVPENQPGHRNADMVPGNVVFLRHAGSLYSVYAHLRPERMRVKPGATVKRGAVLGYCGNSGNSTEPHLHFQLQDGPAFDASWGVEPVFDRVVRTRGASTETVLAYTFLKDDLVRASP